MNPATRRRETGSIRLGSGADEQTEGMRSRIHPTYTVEEESGYHRQARAENAFFRYKSIFGGALRARSPGAQVAETFVACNVLNQTTDLGRPDSYAIGR